MSFNPQADPNRPPQQVLHSSARPPLPPLTQEQRIWLAQRLFFSAYFVRNSVYNEPRLVEVDKSDVRTIEDPDPHKVWEFDAEQLRDIQLLAILNPDFRFQLHTSPEDRRFIEIVQLVDNLTLFVELPDATRIFRHLSQRHTPGTDERHYFLDLVRRVRVPGGTDAEHEWNDAIAHFAGPAGDYSAERIESVVGHCRASFAIFCHSLREYVAQDTTLKGLIERREVPSSCSMEDYLYNFLALAQRSRRRVETRQQFEAAWQRNFGVPYDEWNSSHLVVSWADYLDEDDNGRRFGHYIEEQKRLRREQKKGESKSSRFVKRFSRS
ncbi:hypothetical protein JCM6882_002016 [Rhodosporidiobolus microsporus]